MSGGSYQYAFEKIEYLADDIRGTTLLRRAFKTHLQKVAKACHDIEWVDSCDYAPGDENEAIKACLGEMTGFLILEEALGNAKKALAELQEAINEVEHGSH
jgi:hypothetical protein